MATYNQRGQKVKNQTNVAGNQYNAGGNITHVEGDLVQGDNVAGNKNVFILIGKDLEALQKQVQEAAQSGDLDAETAEDAGHSLRKAAIEAGKEKPDAPKLLGYMDKAKTYLDKAAGVSKSAVGLGASLAAAYAKFKGWL